jgi:glyoxylase-like metal-dependent hydrolase (beta-lactamase superfamily II)
VELGFSGAELRQEIGAARRCDSPEDDQVIVPLHAANPGPMTGPGNWTYFLPGRHPVLIDAGIGLPPHLQAIADARAEGPGHVVVTHAHVDHASGASAIAARWPATVFSKYPWPGRDDRYPVAWRPLGDGDVIAAGDDELQVVFTPGHAPDHVALWHAASRTVFTGDLVSTGTTVVILASHGGSLSQYLASLKRILSMAPARLLPAHGPAIDDPAEIINRYLVHRAMREEQVVAAVGDGLDTVNAIVDRIYVNLSEPLVPMARESVLAHLKKLEDEGRAAQHDGEWRLR